ncbi:MAG: bifunctional DNA-formamidopyrimidine glycosylase/DNA-(apurinic or apyrimidinic site) lyase [Gemmataceae bacterium]
MPELPEVETVVRELRPRLVGCRLKSIQVSRKPLRKRWQRGWSTLLAGKRVRAVDRRGKWIRITLDDDLFLIVHLGMTGQFYVVPADTPKKPHTHIVIPLDQGRHELRFRDVRRFGSATVMAGIDVCDAFFIDSGLGPEPFTLEAAYWRERLAATRRVLKAVLLDQTVVAGVGNIYADEALFEARLHPTLLACDLSRPQADRLRKAVVAVLTRAIEKRGSSIRDYIGGNGAPGNYQHEFRVYGQTGKPCPRCQQPIVCIRLAGRSTHFCAKCQRHTR